MSSAHRWNTDEERNALFKKLCCEIRDDWGDADAYGRGPQAVGMTLLLFELEDVPMYTHTLAELSACHKESRSVGVVRALREVGSGRPALVFHRWRRRDHLPATVQRMSASFDIDLSGLRASPRNGAAQRAQGGREGDDLDAGRELIERDTHRSAPATLPAGYVRSVVFRSVRRVGQVFEAVDRRLELSYARAVEKRRGLYQSNGRSAVQQACGSPGASSAAWDPDAMVRVASLLYR